MPDIALQSSPSAVIACGGTGGHLFPGLAVAGELLRRSCRVTLMVSPKDVDQQAIASISGMETVTLPAVGLDRGRFGFLVGFLKSYRLARKLFSRQRPDFVLAMGGFVSAPPVLAAGRATKTFIHESNSIPGRANRWLARRVDGAFVYFPDAAQRLRARRVEVSGMPVRPEFLNPLSPQAARAALGLNPASPVLLTMGGSQGACKINEMLLAALPQLLRAAPGLQFIHLAGPRDAEKVRAVYSAHNVPALVHPFLADMGLAVAAADVAVSRAGASSLAELSARRLPAVLIPYPTAADNHQYYNAVAFEKSGAARVLHQGMAGPAELAAAILEIVRDSALHAAMSRAFSPWHSPEAAAQIADKILRWNKPALRPIQAVAPATMPVLNLSPLHISHSSRSSHPSPNP